MAGDGFRLPADAEGGDCVLAECPVCKKIVYVLVLPRGDQYLDQIMRQMGDALEAHVTLTGHNSTARRSARERSASDGE